MTTFQEELTQLLKKYGVDNECQTPDHILAEFISDTLKAYEKAVTSRTVHSDNSTAKPWWLSQDFDKQPGPGYRLAEPDDHNRQDVDWWNGTEWKSREWGDIETPFERDLSYRVPEDTIPTNDDLRKDPRPWVMVRNGSDGRWERRRLVSIDPHAYLSYRCEGDLEPDRTNTWKYCRHLRSYER